MKCRQPVYPGMRLGEVLAVLDELQEASSRVWAAGGWGVDALFGRQTRAHRDLDLALDAEDAATATHVLQCCGYTVETDWLPVRVEFTAAGRGWVDLHPVVFDTAGHGRQSDLAGGHFDYPPAAFGTGMLGGVRVPCLSREQQLRFHAGYAPRAVDLHDLELLRRLANEP